MSKTVSSSFLPDEENQYVVVGTVTSSPSSVLKKKQTDKTETVIKKKKTVSTSVKKDVISKQKHRNKKERKEVATIINRASKDSQKFDEIKKTFNKLEQPQTSNNANPCDISTQTKLQPPKRQIIYFKEIIQKIQAELKSNSESKLTNIDSLCTTALATLSRKHRFRKQHKTHKDAANLKLKETEPQQHQSIKSVKLFENTSTSTVLQQQHPKKQQNMLQQFVDTSSQQQNEFRNVTILPKQPPASYYENYYSTLPNTYHHHQPKQSFYYYNGATPAVHHPLSHVMRNDTVRTLTSPAESDHPVCIRIREQLRKTNDPETIESLIEEAEKNNIQDLVRLGTRKLGKLTS